MIHNIHILYITRGEATNLTLKVDHFDGFVNRSSIVNFMITKTSECVIFGAYNDIVEISHLLSVYGGI